MIAKITKGSGFGGLVRYVLDPDKKPIMLEAKQCWGDNANDIALEFTEVAKFRPTTKLPVRHFSIGFASKDSEDDKLTNDIKSEIVARIMEEMGYRDCQYFAVVHDRDDSNHHHVHDHEHIHIVTNAITHTGDRISDFKDYYNLEQCLREIEIDYGLEQVPSSWEKVKKARGIPAPSELQDKVDRALVDSPSLQKWIDRLETSEVNLRFKLTRNGCVQGVSYVHEGMVHKGGDVDRSWRSISSKFENTPENLALMRSANLRTQSLPVELRRHEQELLTKTADLAVQKLVDGKFKDKSVEISIVDDVLTVRRLRPNKQILAAKKDESGEWKSIGVPNIDPKKDLQILGYIKEKDFQALEDRIETSPRSDIPDGNPVNHLRSITNIKPKLVPETNLVSSTNVETLPPEEKVIAAKFISPTIEPMDRELSEMSDTIELVEISESKTPPKLTITKKSKTTKDRGL